MMGGLSKMKMYHYTNPEAYREMKKESPGREGLSPLTCMLIPRYEGPDWPMSSSIRSIKGLLEPEPESWKENKEFPFLWVRLMNSFFINSDELMLLSCEILPKDDAYITDRANIERELYREGREGTTTNERLAAAFEKYWGERVPALEYQGGFELPQFEVLTPIEFERLNVEWVSKTKWREIYDLAKKQEEEAHKKKGETQVLPAELVLEQIKELDLR